MSGARVATACRTRTSFAKFRKTASHGKDEEPKISLVFEDVTFEQTKSENFHKRVAAVLSAQKREQLGNWNEHFEAARER